MKRHPLGAWRKLSTHRGWTALVIHLADGWRVEVDGAGVRWRFRICGPAPENEEFWSSDPHFYRESRSAKIAAERWLETQRPALFATMPKAGAAK